MKQGGDPRAGEISRAVRHIVLVPLPGFSLLSFAAAVDPLRAANRVLQRDAYRWTLATPGGAPTTASNGLSFEAATPLSDVGRAALTLVFMGVDLAPPGAASVIAHLRRRHRQGEAIGGVSGGPHLLARAGLLDEVRCTVHWEYRAAFAAASARAAMSDAPFEIDRGRYTCGGGTATMDMMLAMIGAEHGLTAARAVANQFQHERIRSPADRQRPAAEPDLVGKPDPLARVMVLMSRHIETPLPADALAREARLSVRQLERLFLRHVGRTPTEYYIGLRLARARELLRQTDWSVLDVAAATGFASQSHFAQSYRSAFGLNPSAERRRPAGRILTPRSSA